MTEDFAPDKKKTLKYLIISLTGMIISLVLIIILPHEFNGIFKTSTTIFFLLTIATGIVHLLLKKEKKENEKVQN